MDVFISWSGNRSKFVAEQLRSWLKKVIQVINPWMSSADLLAGARWNAEISKRLAKTKFGIICVTPENLSEPWIQFEAGALAKTIDNTTYVCPYLIAFEEIDPRNPLSQFQCKPATREGTFDILHSMHTALLAAQPDTNLTDAEVKEQFEQWWPRLKEKLSQIPPAPDNGRSEETDPLTEVLELTRSIAASVSTLQRQAADPSLFGYPYITGSPSGPGPGFSTVWAASPSKTLFSRISHGDLSPVLSEIHSPTRLQELVREERAAATKEHKIELKIVCPRCGETGGISLFGLAHTVEDGKARHLDIRCERCAPNGERELAVHITRSDRSQTPCPESCPNHPKAMRR